MEDQPVPQKVGLLGALVARLGLDPDEAVVSGRSELAYDRTRDHYSGGRVDVHLPRLVRLSVGDGKTTFANVAPGSPEFAEAAKALADVRRLPLCETLTEPGVPHVEGVDFTLPWRELSDLALAEELFFQALVDDDEAAMVEAGWTRFRHSGAFKRMPCTRDEFAALQAEFKVSSYARGMDLTQYYDWWRESEAKVDGEGFDAATMEMVSAMLGTWKTFDRGQTLSWMNRNLRIHPRHRHVTERVVDARLATRPGPAEVPDEAGDDEAPATPAP